jgi:hypothetical protein
VHALSTRCFCGCSNVGVGAVGIIAIGLGLRKVAHSIFCLLLLWAWLTCYACPLHYSVLCLAYVSYRTVPVGLCVVSCCSWWRTLYTVLCLVAYALYRAVPCLLILYCAVTGDLCIINRSVPKPCTLLITYN